jgi:hypothetical protein
MLMDDGSDEEWYSRLKDQRERGMLGSSAKKQRESRVGSRGTQIVVIGPGRGSEGPQVPSLNMGAVT